MPDLGTVQRLQEALRRHHQELHDDPLTSGGQQREAKVGLILKVTQQLLAAEKQFTAAVIEHSRQNGVRAIRKITLWAAAAAAAGALAAAVGLTSRGWLVLCVPIVLAALLARAAESQEPHAGQRERRAGVWVLAMAAAGVVATQTLVTLVHVTAWTAAIPVLLIVSGVVTWTSGIAPDGHQAEDQLDTQRSKP